MSLGGVAALVASGGFVVLVLFLAVPILRARHTVDAATTAICDAANRTTPMLERANTTIDNLNTALMQVHSTLDGVNLQLARIDTITENVSHVSANVANLSTVVSAAAASPLAKVAAFGYGIRRAVGIRRHIADEAEIREQRSH
ncbi:DUF948 domain-containing protein [Dactylosporangium sp. CS-047395]|uniref:DUF948 domain-containing protein n=1 Tax=Dactylosporangium sp. CS-047395 TaxID=3239936 RepID=UPI003D89BB0F